MGESATNHVVTVTLHGGPDDGLEMSVHESTRMLIRRKGDILHEYRSTAKHPDRMAHHRVWRDQEQPEG
jgi:hypothetical protein